ncbi:class II aldolase/adducin family protein [Trichloromonas sp.]|uniref:class II aldolase/adducin family protein n=1 Tax=Trichloromonas sp. TaxID=3069249 RepID=UPI002A3E3F89|nr:class II aldolase/adducin family protein [Trichloromonas sp.]
MTEQEGVIQYRLSHQPEPPLPMAAVAELIAWRRILHRLDLIGEDPQRYGGFGFGNLSVRLPSTGAARYPFLVSGTQTGALAELGPEHFVTVLEWLPRENQIVSKGPVHPSSEAMTHAGIYTLDQRIRAVIHVHSPHIWQAARWLDLPTTPAAAGCGTPAMAQAVRELLARREQRRRRVFVMLGHEDGVVAFGPSLSQAGCALLNALADAYRTV